MEQINSYSQFFKEMNQYPLLSADEEKAAVRKYKESGDPASKQLLVNSNLKFITSIAKKYMNPSTGFTLMDLVQEGVIGFIIGLDHFDEARGTRLNTYVASWVKQNITRAIANKSRNVDIPVYMVENISKYRKAEAEVMQNKSSAPVEEIADKLGWSISKVINIQRYLNDTVSLDTPIGDDDEESTLGAFVQDDKASPEEHYEGSEMMDSLLRAIDTLPPREATVLKMRYGVGEYDRIYTLDEVGEKLKVTRARAQQIEKAAMTKMRNPLRSRMLKDYL